MSPSMRPVGRTQGERSRWTPAMAASDQSDRQSARCASLWFRADACIAGAPLAASGVSWRSKFLLQMLVGLKPLSLGVSDSSRSE